MVLYPRPAVNVNRHTLLVMIREQPGISRSELTRGGPWSNGTVDWHLERLVRNGSVRSVRRGGSRAFYPAEVPPNQFENLPPTHGRLMEIVMLRGRVGQTELSQTMQVNPSTVTRAVAALGADGWITVDLEMGQNIVSVGWQLREHLLNETFSNQVQ